MKSIIQLNQPTVFERVIVLIAMHNFIIQSVIWLRGDDKLIGFNQLHPKTRLDNERRTCYICCYNTCDIKVTPAFQI